jgi:hypothetical protein
MIDRKLFLCAMLVTCLALAGPVWAGTFNFNGASLGQGALYLDPTTNCPGGICGSGILTVGSDGTHNGALITDVLNSVALCGGDCAITGGYMTLTSGHELSGTCNGTSCSYTFNATGSTIDIYGKTLGMGSVGLLMSATFVSGATFSTSGTVGTYSGALSVPSIFLNSVFLGPYHWTGGSGDAITISLDANGCNNGGICSGEVDQAAASLQFSPIPEPATLSVLGVGLLALGTGLRRKMLLG